MVSNVSRISSCGCYGDVCMQVNKPEPAVVDLQKMPQILTLEELEKKLAGAHACVYVYVYVCVPVWVCACARMCSYLVYLQLIM